jgi:hypothetical protein
MSKRTIWRLVTVATAGVALGGCSSSYTTEVQAPCGYGAFGGSCAPANPFLELRVSTVTTGTNLPSGMYGVRVTRDSCVRDSQIGPNVSTTKQSCGEGSNTVELRDVPANCSVAGGSLRSVNVTSTSLPTAQFDVTCI